MIQDNIGVTCFHYCVTPVALFTAPFLGIWVACSLGTPCMATLYVGCLGRTLNLETLGEQVISTNETNKIVRFPESGFIKDLSKIVIFPAMVFLGPLSIPLSILFSFFSTINYFIYIFKLCVYTEHNFADNNI